MEGIDFDRALVLMNLIEKITTVSPMSTALMGLAQRELKSINDAAVEIQRQVAEEEKAKQAKIDAERQHNENVAAAEAAGADEDSEPAPTTTRRL